MKYIPYGRQFIDDDDIAAVVDVLKSDWLTQGPKIKIFEDMAAQYHNCKYAVAFANGTAALHGAYYVSTKFPFGKQERILADWHTYMQSPNLDYAEYQKIKERYFEFITTPLSFVATANAGLYCGGKPVFVDIDINTYNIDITKIEEAITDYTRVITPVSYAGYPVDIQAIRNLPSVKKNNICIIHDACHALGARLNGHGIADFADMTVLSFHPVKHICAGEGGMVLTNNQEYYHKLLRFRSHGITKNAAEFINISDGDWYYEMQELGYNYRLTDMQAALGASQFSKVDKFIYRRNQVAEFYEQALAGIDWLKLPPRLNKGWLTYSQYNDLQLQPQNLHSYHLFPIFVEESKGRQKLFNHLRQNNIGIQVHYVPVNQQPTYSHNTNPLPATQDLYQGLISLPIFYGLQDADLENTITQLLNFNNFN